VASPFVLAFVVVGLGCWVLDPAALSVVVDVLSGGVPVSGGRRLGLGFGAFSLFSSLPVGLPPLLWLWSGSSVVSVFAGVALAGFLCAGDFSGDRKVAGRFCVRLFLAGLTLPYLLRLS